MADLPPSGGRFLHRPLCPQGKSIPIMECTAPCAERDRPLVLAATILASAMAFIDGTVVTIALPALQSDLSADFGALQWVVNAYTLLLASLILIGGSAGDRFGRKRIFVGGIAVFALASFACALAPSIEALILARACQGVGAALLVPQSLAVIAAAFPKVVRGRAIGIWAGASAITTAMGPPLGGVLIDMLDWRAVFWINIPLSVIITGLALRYIPESRDEKAVGSLDWGGGALAVLAFGALTVGLTLLSDSQASTSTSIVALALGVAGLAAFLRTEARAANPLMPLALFSDRAFSAANIMTLCLYGALTGILFLLPFDLIERRGLTASEVGFVLLPIGLIIGALSRVSGAIADRYGPRHLLVLGSLLVALAALLMAEASDPFWLAVMLPVVVLSTGMALVVAPLTTAVMNAAADERAGTASGVNNAASRLAGLFAVAILGSVASLVFFSRLDLAETGGDALRFGVLPAADAPARAASEAAFLSGYAAALWIAALWGLLAAVIAWWYLRPAPPATPAGRGAAAA